MLKTILLRMVEAIKDFTPVIVRSVMAADIAGRVKAILAGVTQFLQVKMLTPKNQPKTQGKNLQFGDMLQKQTLYFFPIFTILILWRLPSAIGLYWVATTIFSIIQQYLILKKTAAAVS